ncbi:delta tubulin, putative [Plasmodium berghei]|uniref:Tubulin delta chain n=2 Tax=Plasmodium berghei TaxID=5821 RepID=A0A509AJI6_PLABA|nr:tubulin delta chain, putative [Plasmodium berghei ANKA]CXI36971.1 delta tubulin, putative [Plasmodium berghei]SCM21637.1 delta tubulin, putative [Plasmodium berghei]SCN24840.1 delta tubulin, putative [Plasmodium berghei]SCO59956.1 delta tubulin, putative [Plasmodium berghei]SCO61328.1 delta tubulin, putative [Plasmodium berghei]|eukprot:XP_034421320.1 tubulin delta chain, putative [Plasmodium berghei ANKA]
MGVLGVQIGQCGNQLGMEFYDAIYKHIMSCKNGNLKNKLINMYFDEECEYDNNIFPIIEYEGFTNNKNIKGHIINPDSSNVKCLNNYIARCILIDMEPKVIEKCLNGNKFDKNSPDYSNYILKNKNKKYEKIRNSEFGEYDNEFEKSQKYICGLNEYYEPTNNFIKIFEKKCNIIKLNDNYKNRNSMEEKNEKQNYSYCKKFDNFINKEIENNTKNIDDNNIVNVSSYSKMYSINQWKYNKNNVIYGLNGSGNNWSYGFNVHAKNICEDFINLINKELEKNNNNECIDNIILFHSLAGGSGSGISSYISYILKDEYPKINLFNICVLPYTFGEISVQSLNTILCLSSIYEVSDCVMVFENDKFELMCKKINNGGISGDITGHSLHSFGNIDTNNINKYICQFLVHTIGLPIDYSYLKNNSNYKYSNFMNSIISDLCCHSNYKLLSARYLPQVYKENLKFEQNTFNMLIKRMHKMVINGNILDYSIGSSKDSAEMSGYLNSYMDSYFPKISEKNLRNNNIFQKIDNIPIHLNETISKAYVDKKLNSIFLWSDGNNINKYQQMKSRHPYKIFNKNNNLKNLQNNINSTNFNHNNVIFNSKMIMRGEVNENINLNLFKNNVLYSNRSLNPIEIYIDENKYFGNNSLSMLSNCLTPIPGLKKVLQNAKMLYSTNAYIYQYNNYGVTNDNIHNSLMGIDQIINSYESLSLE